MNLFDINPFEVVTAAAGAALGYGYLCRINILRSRRHRSDFVLLHYAGFVFCGAVVLLDPGSTSGYIIEAVGLAFLGAWLKISYVTWGGGSPPAYVTRPAPLDAGRSRVWEDA